MSLISEIKRRRTFAIISHPDAGKTTLTEKLLLFGGAIQTAGAVKSNKIKKNVTSDFMEIERQRGISVATSVMGFNYRDRKINILDTPGHQDFAEDTYRTLTAVDSVIVVIDVAKGVEAQTEKLVQVSRMRNIPIMVFINKLDRMGKDPMELLDEIELKLGLNVTPLSWPIGMGKELEGVYDLYREKLHLFRAHSTGSDESALEIADINDPILDQKLFEKAPVLREEVALIREVYPEFNRDEYLDGSLNPVFFGSAVNNFGVKELLDTFVEISPEPRPSKTAERSIEPNENAFTGFIFKIHANMDPKHRDRIAFVKICSGEFQRNKAYRHVRLGKDFKFSSPTSFMAEKKSVIDHAYPGDIVGLHDTGNFKIGDALTEGEALHFVDIPTFSPELFKVIENADPMKYKQLAKGIDQLMDEGVAQLFTMKTNNRKVIGTVGALQFEVIQYRLEHEYGAKCRYEPINVHKAVWVTSENKEELEEFTTMKYRSLAEDKRGRLVFMADTPFALDMARDKYTSLKFHTKAEF